MTTQFQASYVQTVDANSPALAAAVSQNTIVVTSPFAGNVTGVTYTPSGAIAGAATNTRTLTLYNQTKGVAIATLALAAGVNLAAFVASALALNAANVAVNAGDVLTFNSVFAGTGIADPGGLVTVTLSAVDSGDAHETPYFETPPVQPNGQDSTYQNAG